MTSSGRIRFRVRVRTTISVRVRGRVGVGLQEQSSKHPCLQHLVRGSSGAKTKRLGIPGMFEKQ